MKAKPISHVAGRRRVTVWLALGVALVAALLGAPETGAPAGAQIPCATKVITGTPGDDVLVGTLGDDCLEGLGGDDEISGAGGVDGISGRRRRRHRRR